MCEICKKLQRLSMNGTAHIVIGACGGNFAIKFFPSPADLKHPESISKHNTIVGRCIKEVIEEADKVTKIDIKSEEYIKDKL
jgi:hypothetical protein